MYFQCDTNHWYRSTGWLENLFVLPGTLFPQPLAERTIRPSGMTRCLADAAMEREEYPGSISTLQSEFTSRKTICSATDVRLLSQARSLVRVVTA